MKELTAGLIGEFASLSGGKAESALAGFARRFPRYQEGNFEALIGPLEAVSGALPHLQKLTALATDAPEEIGPALATTSSFVKTLYRVGFGTALGLIAERGQGVGESAFMDVVVRTCQAVADLNPDGPTVVGTLNYDGLLHAGFLEAVSTSGMTDLAGGYDPVTATPDGTTACTGYPLRTEDNLQWAPVQLLNLHGSLAWLADPDTGEAWKFELERLREMNYWDALRTGKAHLLPVVVLTNRKSERVLTWPFYLGYRAFEARMALANKWLIAGYSFRDESVNKALSRAANERASAGHAPPEILVVTTRSEVPFRAKVVQAIGVSAKRIRVQASGLPNAVSTSTWDEWST